MITKQQVHDRVMRVLAFYTHLSAVQIAHYVDALHEVFGSWADPEKFNLACIGVLKELDSDSRVLPKPGSYRAHYFIATGSDRSVSAGCTQAESDAWCQAEIDRHYSPEMAWEMLQKIDGDPRMARCISQPVMAALMEKSAGADPEKLAQRKADRTRDKIRSIKLFNHSIPEQPQAVPLNTTT